MNSLITAIQEQVQLTNEDIQVISDHFIKKEYAKNSVILKEDQYCQHLYFLEKGTVRTYYYHDIKEITSWFYRENQFFSSWYSFYSKQPSFEYVETVESSIIYSINKESYEKLNIAIPAFERTCRYLLEQNTAFIDLFSKGYMFMSAKERYDLILSHFPDITLRVNLGHIASFLGISQETLSRIRKKK